MQMLTEKDTLTGDKFSTILSKQIDIGKWQVAAGHGGKDMHGYGLKLQKLQ
jgi:hypothetical protein